MKWNVKRLDFYEIRRMKMKMEIGKMICTVWWLEKYELFVGSRMFFQGEKMGLEGCKLQKW